MLKSKASGDLPEEKLMNLIDVLPKKLEVKEAEHWKEKDFNKVRDFKQVEIISDWTYSTPYKGSVFYLNNHLERIKNETSFVLPPSSCTNKITVEPTEEEIPFHKLGPDNKVINVD